MELLTTIMPEFINLINRLVYYFAIPAMVFLPPQRGRPLKDQSSKKIPFLSKPKIFV
jgi:predicted permease